MAIRQLLHTRHSSLRGSSRSRTSPETRQDFESGAPGQLSVLRMQVTSCLDLLVHACKAALPSGCLIVKQAATQLLIRSAHKVIIMLVCVEKASTRENPFPAGHRPQHLICRPE